MFKPVDLKPDFPALEREKLEHWYKDGIVDKYLHRNDFSKERFSFFDGPITANNPMGVHHGWGRTYKDLWQKYKNMRGFKQRFQNGFDCQGLWVEVEVEKELGIRNKKEIENLVDGDKNASIAKFVQLCKDRVLKFSQIQTDQSKRLGYFMNWDNSYFTMSDENNYMIWYFLKVCHEKGWIYRGKDNVPWCPRCQTAISQHEMLTEDYKELTHETVFFKLPIISDVVARNIMTKQSQDRHVFDREAQTESADAREDDNIDDKWSNTSLLVWTTTPWTIPANVGVGINKKFKYKVWENKNTGEKIIFIGKDENGNTPTRILKGKELPIHDYIFSGIEDAPEYHEVKEISGEELVGLKYKAPFDFLPISESARAENPETFHTVVETSEVVVSTEGTGLLHVAPGCGKEDFDLSKKYKLPIIEPINDEAFYVEGMNEWSGQNAKKHPEIIIDYLKTKPEYLLKTLNYTHRYPACWRCKTELVWKVTNEWYIAMDTPENLESRIQNSELKDNKKEGKTLRELMMETAKKIIWHPGFGLERELDWLSNMHDWLISKKNRYWGLALPIYECQKCGKFQVIGSYEELKEKAVYGWEKFEKHSPHKPYIDEVKIKCDECGDIVSRIDDVGNVWLDAGIIPFSTLIDPATKKLSYTTDKEYFKQWFPADFITESFPGQFKNWFYSLIAMATVLEKSNPFETVLGYASMLAEDGRPMHKSWGNSIEFNEAADKIGVDVMRWMYSKADPESNLLFGYKRADETRRKFLLMLWNVYNFFVTYANIDEWSRNNTQDNNRSNNILDKWILSLLNNLILEVEDGLDNYKSREAADAIESFINNLSLWYIRRSRDRVGPTAKNNDDKNNFYATGFTVLTTLCKLLAPFTPFVSDEIYVNLTGEESVHLSSWPEENVDLIDSKLEDQMKIVRQIVELGLSQRKEKQMKVKQPLAKFTVHSSQLIADEKLLQLIKDELNVKNIVLEKSTGLSLKGEGEMTGELDLKLTPELINEGKARDIVRSIQEKRKELETTLTEKVNVTLESIPEGFENYIKENALVENIELGKEFEVKKIG